MPAVLEVTPDERPVLAYTIARLIPPLERGTKENRETAANLAYTLSGLDAAPPGPGEVELLVLDLYDLGVRIYAASVDLEEYWLDRVAILQGRPAVEVEDAEVSVPARRYFPELDADPLSWDFRSVQPAFIELGFKIDRLLTDASPRVRGLYNKERTAIVRTAVQRHEKSAALREQQARMAPRPQLPPLLPAGNGVEGYAAPRHVEGKPAPTGARPVGTAVQLAPGGVAEAGPLVAAAYPSPYMWGVVTATGVSVDALEPDKPLRINVGGTQLMLANVDGKVCAASRVCPHRGWDLARSEVVDATITCGLHGATFDFCSGKVLAQPYNAEFNRDHALMGGMMGAFDPKKVTDPLETYPTSVDATGEVHVRL